MRNARPDNGFCDVVDAASWSAGKAPRRAVASQEGEACVDSPVDSWLPPGSSRLTRPASFILPACGASQTAHRRRRAHALETGSQQDHDPDHGRRQQPGQKCDRTGLACPPAGIYVRSLFIECSIACAHLRNAGQGGGCGRLRHRARKRIASRISTARAGSLHEGPAANPAAADKNCEAA